MVSCATCCVVFCAVSLAVPRDDSPVEPEGADATFSTCSDLVAGFDSEGFEGLSFDEGFEVQGEEEEPLDEGFDEMPDSGFDEGFGEFGVGFREFDEGFSEGEDKETVSESVAWGKR